MLTGPERVGTAAPTIPLLTLGARLIDAATGAEFSGARLTGAVGAVAAALEHAPRGVVLCLAAADAAAVVRYLGVLAAGRPALMWDPGTPASVLDELVERYAPAAVIGLSAGTAPARGAPNGYRVADCAPLGTAWIRRDPFDVVPHEQLSLLLGTSGSTGQPRLVRHSAAAVQASASAIGQALRIDSGDVAITSLPLFYTFGVSVLHSHLLAGATVVIDGRRLVDQRFWRSVDRYGVTSLAGVPHTYELLARRPWRPAASPSVRTLTVSGGRLRDELVTRFHAEMTGHGGRMYVMYGQTEACSRICVLPPESLPAKLGSVGPAIPGTRLSIVPDGADTGGDSDGGGEVVCHSATVMMGYADRAEDLARGDDLHGTLHTGDRGRIDAEGYLWLSGRLSRIGKAYGVRVNLDAVEHVVSAIAPAAAVGGDDRITIWCECLATERLSDVAALVAGRLRIHPSAIRVAALESLPRRPNGKLDYSALPD